MESIVWWSTGRNSVPSGRLFMRDNNTKPLSYIWMKNHHRIVYHSEYYRVDKRNLTQKILTFNNQ